MTGQPRGSEAMAWTRAEVPSELSIAGAVRTLQAADRALLEAVVAHADAARRRVESEEFVPEFVGCPRGDSSGDEDDDV